MAKLNPVIIRLIKLKSEIESRDYDETHCYQHALAKENANNHIGPTFMDSQNEVNATMRIILFDWMIEVHVTYCLGIHVYLLSCNIVDRYLSKKQVPRKHFQLLGVAAIFIASKYEDAGEGYGCGVSATDLSFITDYCYTRGEVLEMEIQVLKVLDHRIHLPTAFDFLCCFIQPLTTTTTLHLLIQYFVELSTYDVNMYKYKPSLIAMASVHIAHKLLNKPDWDTSISRFCCVSEEIIGECSKDLHELHERIASSKWKCIFRKYKKVWKINQ